MTTLERSAAHSVEEIEDALREELRPLAKDVVADLVDWQLIIGKYDMNAVEFSELLDLPIFQSLLTEEKAKWEAPENTARRIQMKGLMSVESSLLDISSIVGNPKLNPVVRVKAFSEMIKIAGTDNVAAAKAQGGGSGKESFSVSIHLGGGQEPLCISGSTEDAQDAEFARLPEELPEDAA